MNTILVTGSKGVVGTKLVKELSSRGYIVFGCDIRHDKDEIAFSTKTDDDKANYIRCDVSKFRQLERIFNDFGTFDYVYHLAAEFGRWNGEDFYENLWLTNAVGTKNIITLCDKYKSRLIFASTSEVYGDYGGIMVEGVTDTIEIKQLNDYAISKWANEIQIANSDIDYVIFRLFNTYGPGEYYSPYRSVVCRFAYCAISGIPFTVYRKHKRSYTYIDDAVRTLANICENFRNRAKYNISSNKVHTVEEMSDLVIEHSGCNPMLRILSDPEPMTTRSKITDTSKSRAELSHVDTVNLSDGILNTVEWMRTVYK